MRRSASRLLVLALGAALFLALPAGPAAAHEGR